MKRHLLKETLKKIIRPLLNEITLEPLKGYGMAQPDKFMNVIGKDVKSANAIVNFNRENGKITIQDETGGNKVSIELVPNCDKSECYDLTVIYNKSDRDHLKNLKIDDVSNFLKTCFKDSDKKSYVEKAYEKNSIEKQTEKKPLEVSDKMEEVKKYKKTTDHKPKDNKDRKLEDVLKGHSSMQDASKFKKQSDAKSVDKVSLKSDKKNSSDEKVKKKMK